MSEFISIPPNEQANSYAAELHLSDSASFQKQATVNVQRAKVENDIAPSSATSIRISPLDESEREALYRFIDSLDK